MERGIFGLEGEEYWTSPRRNQREALAKLARMPDFGFVLDAPSEVDSTRHASIPLLLAYADTKAHAHEVRIGHEAKIVAVRLEDGEVLTGGLGLRQPDIPASWAGSHQPTSAVYLIDGARQLGIPGRGGTYLVTAVMREWISNRLVVRVSPVPAPSVVVGIESDPWPSGSVLPPPEGHGITLAASAKGVVEGAFWLPMRDEVAGIDLSLVVVTAGTTNLRADESGPAWVVPLRAPASERDAGGAKVGVFRLDLGRRGSTADPTRTHYVYAFAYEAMAGPVRIEAPPPRIM
jgi:hypothetical protein